MYRKIVCMLFLGWLIIFLPGETMAQNKVVAETQVYSIVAEASQGETLSEPSILLRIIDKTTNATQVVHLVNRMEQVVSLYLIDQKKLLIHGTLGSGGDILTILQIETGQILDTMWGWGASVAPDRTKVAYNFRYPPQSIPLYRTSVLLIYDLTRTPEENSMDNSRDNALNRGFILWPEQNRQQQQYFIPPENYEQQQHIISPITWNMASTKVCFLMHPGNRERQDIPTSLVVIDISKGLRLPEVALQEVNASLLYQQSELQKMPSVRTIPAESLHFMQNDSAVEIIPYRSSIFDNNKRAIIPIDE